MLIQHPTEVDDDSGQPTKPQHTLTTASPSHISSGPTTLVVDETVHEERVDRVERAATTAASLDAEQDNGDRPAQTRFMNHLSQELTDLEVRRTDLEITHLKKRVKRLEKKRKSRTPQLKRRLFKVKIESSVVKSLGDQEDASNQWRNDQDEGISFVQDAEIQGRYGHDIESNTASTSITTVSINITTVEPITTQEQERLGFEAAVRLQAELDEEERQRIAKQLRGYSFDEIKTLFETTIRRANTIESEVDRAVPELAARSSKRDAEE
uniref:Uncharacterized protein n=1 Tax=Tanacetum cinerariifolium TaxID=118510 RepID=A0A699I4D4_TANCI|nr:hypothetical protein [Tanacetum cinerariifolium]